MLWRYARRTKELLRADVTDDELAALTAKSTPGLLGLLLSTALGFVLPSIAAICFFAVSLFLVVPFREIREAVRGVRRREN